MIPGPEGDCPWEQVVREHGSLMARGGTATGKPAARRLRAPYLAAAYRATWLLWPLTPPASKVTTCRDTQAFISAEPVPPASSPQPGKDRRPQNLVPVHVLSVSELTWERVGGVTIAWPTVWRPWLWV